MDLSIISSRGGLVVQRLLHKKRHCATVDQIPLGDDYINRPNDVCFAVMVYP